MKINQVTEKEKSIIFELHESDFIDLKFEEKNLVIRVAITCELNDSDLGLSEEQAEEMSYVYDIICHNCTMYDGNYSDELDLLLVEILDFDVYDEKYKLSLWSSDTDYIYITFDCESIEWLPIKIMHYLELDANAEKYQFNKAKNI